jgi:hypothetical protein
LDPVCGLKCVPIVRIKCCVPPYGTETVKVAGVALVATVVVLLVVATATTCYYLETSKSPGLETSNSFTREYLSSAVGSCLEEGPEYSGYVPCFSYDRSGAYVFDCAAAAATATGCSLHIGNATAGFDLTVWYPVTNQSLPIDNCAYEVGGSTYNYFASCISVSSSSFIVNMTVPHVILKEDA